MNALSKIILLLSFVIFAGSDGPNPNAKDYIKPGEAIASGANAKPHMPNGFIAGRQQVKAKAPVKKAGLLAGILGIFKRGQAKA
jgi:hypothetical protein